MKERPLSEKSAWLNRKFWLSFTPSQNSVKPNEVDYFLADNEVSK